MTQSKSDLIFHPVRMRLITELAGRQLTPGQLAAALPDIPQATLYRHIKRLQAGGLIEVTAEQVVNGATERTFAVVAGQVRLTDADLEGLTVAEHIRNFATFAASLIDAFSRYAQQAEPTAMAADGVSYNRAVIYLNDVERAEFQEAVVALLQNVMSQQPTSERKRYTLASVIIPDERNPST
jgi:DNA-binding transcriptional ArsR family regulator